MGLLSTDSLEVDFMFATGVFPDSWKIARVTPIFKSGQTDDQSNYRPISVLHVLARIFEQLIFNQICKYLDTNKHLFPKQSGFRLLYSVVTSLLSCTNDWYKNMDTGKYTALVFIDLKNAFDIVDHDILLKKMQKYGVSGNELFWFTSSPRQTAVMQGQWCFFTNRRNTLWCTSGNLSWTPSFYSLYQLSSILSGELPGDHVC